MGKKLEIPTVEMLIQKICEMVEIDTLTERMKNGNIDRIKNIWKVFYMWLGG